MDRHGAMVAFCREHHRRLVGLVALQVGDRGVAEELAQDVLVQVCEKWDSVDDPRAWSNRLAVNMSSSWWRRRYAEWRANARHHASGRDVPSPDSAATVAVRTAVAKLPQRQRQALAYRYYVGFSVAETADAMGCAEGTVRALTHQAISRLREQSGLVDGLAADDEEEPSHVS